MNEQFGLETLSGPQSFACFLLLYSSMNVRFSATCVNSAQLGSPPFRGPMRGGWVGCLAQQPPQAAPMHP